MNAYTDITSFSVHPILYGNQHECALIKTTWNNVKPPAKTETGSWLSPHSNINVQEEQYCDTKQTK
jgi:hypothetical protein